MISTLIGKKLGMTQVYDAQNVLVPVTVVEAGPCAVVQVKTLENDGYHAVQLGFSKQKLKNASKAELNHAKKACLEAAPRVLGEVRLTELGVRRFGEARLPPAHCSTRAIIRSPRPLYDQNVRYPRP